MKFSTRADRHVRARFTHLDGWFGRLMRTKMPGGKPVLASPEGVSNFGWYQGVVGQLAAHVQSHKEAEALSHIRRLASGDVSPPTPGIIEDLEAMAPGARALLDSLGAGYGSRDK